MAYFVVLPIMTYLKLLTVGLLLAAIPDLGHCFRGGSFGGTTLTTEVLTGHYDTPNIIQVNRSIEYIFQFTTNNVTMHQPARITVECNSSNRSFPVLIVVRQQKGVLSWQLPLIVETKSGIFDYNLTSRTLCPDNNYYRPHPSLPSLPSPASSEEIIVSVATASLQNLTVSLSVELEHDFILNVSTTYNVTVSPAEPRYYGFVFERDGPSTVLLRVDSDDLICMTISVQNMSCPVFDLERNVQFEGYWQTMNKRGGVTLTRSAFPHGFYVVFVAKGDDTDCAGTYQTLSRDRRKTVTFALTPGISVDDYLIATFGALAVFVVFYVVAILVSLMHCFRYGRGLQSASQYPTFDTFDGTPSSSAPATPATPGAEGGGYGRIESPGEAAGAAAAAGGTRSRRTSSDSSLDETDIDMLRDAEREKDVFRTKMSMYIKDMARKHPKILKKKSQLYLWNLLTVGTFYALPVVQLVITYQNVLNQTGNQDLCYYNFLCSHPFGFLSDFNHVFSNVGYVLLGLLFVGLTYRRERMHRTLGESQDKHYGIPQHYGLFYAMGAALMMEGIMSGCYHVCPNHSNFQFDTSFMYVMAMVSMVKIYQTRHPDINASAYATYGVLAAVIFVGMWGVLDGGSLAFWIVFTVVHLVSCFVLTAQIYYMGRWRLDCGMFRRVVQGTYYEFRASPLHCITPMYPSRMVLLVLGNLFNWGLAAFGLKYHLNDFATHLLIIFMANLLLYYHFYIVMKLLCGERLLTQPLIYFVLSFVAWGGSLYFFFNKSISWALTPAGSKAFNRPCAILDFYDNHDVWHFLSAASMFFSFMVLLTLDDDLVSVHRSTIAVF